jgi:hypothetical protein
MLPPKKRQKVLKALIEGSKISDTVTGKVTKKVLDKP